MHLSTPSLASRDGLARIAFVLSAVVLSTAVAPAAAQITDPCSDLVSVSESYYRQGRFDDVIALVTECLNSEVVAPETAVAGYRLLALAYLRSDNVPDARLAVLQLIAVDPLYEPDAVQDPPSYIALVANVREQIGITDRPVVTGEPLDSSPRQDGPFDSVTIRLRGGLSTYGGERGVSAGSQIGEFGDNAGPSGELEFDYGLSGRVAIGFFYQASRYPHVHDAKSGPLFPTIEEEKSSPWIHYLGPTIRAAIPTQRALTPYGFAGPFIAFTVINDSIEIGAGPRFGAGLDYAYSETTGIFVEIDGMMTFPGTAVDLVDAESTFDLFMNAALGLRLSLSTSQ